MSERIREMWNDQRLLDLLDIEHPIIQAPMAGSTTSELVAAVNGAGALGTRRAAFRAGNYLARARRASL
jgi:nitronate monooxygenase